MTELNAIQGWESAIHVFHFLLSLQKDWTVRGNDFNMTIRNSVKWFQLFPGGRDWHLSWAANRKESNSSGVQVLLQFIWANTEAKYIKTRQAISYHTVLAGCYCQKILILLGHLIIKILFLSQKVLTVMFTTPLSKKLQYSSKEINNITKWQQIRLRLRKSLDRLSPDVTVHSTNGCKYR